MPDITLAHPDDLPALHDMVRALSAFHGQQATVTPAQLTEIFFGPAPVATALIAKQAGTPIGYAGLTREMVIHEATIRMDIHHLFIHQPYRAQGIGTALIKAATTYALSLGATRVTIGTDPGNTSAIAAYRSMPDLQEITDAGPRFKVTLTG